MSEVLLYPSTQQLQLQPRDDDYLPPLSLPAPPSLLPLPPSLSFPVSPYTPHTWGMALLSLGSALPRWLVRAFALS
jgi:hypothetical protein